MLSAACALPFALAACSVANGAGGLGGAAQLSGEDRDSLDELSLIAARDAFAGGTLSGETPAVPAVECWAPSAHLFERQKFRVLCRVHFDEAGTPRYRDMICIGEVGREPVSDGCYQWAPYTGMPAFEDAPAYQAERS